MKTFIKTIPHDKQRYESVGDYFRDEEGNLHIYVSDMGNDLYAALVAIHELVEVVLCEARGIKEEDITAFDIAFEDRRAPGNIDEPGDDPKAPYSKEHCFATGIERLLCAELGLSWKKYDHAVLSVE